MYMYIYMYVYIYVYIYIHTYLIHTLQRVLQCVLQFVLQCVAVCCSVLQCVLARWILAQCCVICLNRMLQCALQCVLQCVLQCAAVCCSVLQCVAVCCSVYSPDESSPIVAWHISFMCCSVCCSVRCSVCCSVLQYVAMCCSVLQRVAVLAHPMNPRSQMRDISHSYASLFQVWRDCVTWLIHMWHDDVTWRYDMTTSRDLFINDITIWHASFDMATDEFWRTIAWHDSFKCNVTMKNVSFSFWERGGGLGSSTISKNLMSPTPRRKWYLTTGRRAH